MSKLGKTYFPVLFILIPVCIYLIYAFSNIGSLFFADDFHLLKTVVWMQEVDSPLEKFKLLIQQHNEHRIVFPRLLTWLDYHMEGSINWRTLAMFGNLLWVSVLLFFWKGFKSLNIAAWLFIPVPWILLQPQYYDNINWSISILQQSVIIFWFGLFCYLCSKKLFTQAMFVAVVATFTHGNGIFSFLIGIIFLSLDRNWKGVFKWLLLLFFVALIYFWGFEKGQNADFQKSLSDPLRLTMAFFAFFGALTKVQFASVNYAVVCGGVFVVALAVYMTPKLSAHFSGKEKLSFFNKLLFGNILFLGITAALVCVSRSWGGVDNVLAPRYQHYAPFVACWVYIILLASTRGILQKILGISFIIIGVLFNGLCYFIYNEEVVLRKNWLLADTQNWERHQVFLNYAASFNHNIHEPYTKAMERGICRPTASGLFVPEGQNQAADLRLHVSKTMIEEHDAGGTYSREFVRIAGQETTGETYLYLQKGMEEGYWLPTRLLNTGIRKLLRTGQVYQPGFEIQFMTENLPAGSYKVGVLNNKSFRWNENPVDISR